MRHLGWAGRKLLGAFPYDIKLDRQIVRVADKSVANGVGALLNAMGYYDPNNMYLLMTLFQKNLLDKLFDVGANVGVYSLISAGAAASVRVAAFEPHPYTFSLLEENVKLNHFEDRISCFQVALGDRDGLVHFMDKPGSPENRITEHDIQEAAGLKVPIQTGNTICDRVGFLPQVLKVDVEGYENSVLAGFGSRLSAVQLVLVECWDIRSTVEILCEQHGFLGPYKVDFRNHYLVRDHIHDEDWLFIRPALLNPIKSLMQENSR